MLCRARSSNNFRRGDRLPHMSLRVLGNVHQQAAYSRRQQLPPHSSRRFQVSRGERAHPTPGPLQRFAQFVEYRCRICTRRKFVFQRFQLLFAKLSPFGIGEQAIHTPSDVPQMKRNRSHAAGPCVELFNAEFNAPSFEIFTRKLQRVQHCTMHRGQFGQRSS